MRGAVAHRAKRGRKRPYIIDGTICGVSPSYAVVDDYAIRPSLGAIDPHPGGAAQVPHGAAPVKIIEPVGHQRKIVLE